MKYSHSRIESFSSCPYKFKLNYIDKLDTIPDGIALNHLHLGNMIHDYYEHGYNIAIKNYYDKYNIISDEHINETIKLDCLKEKMDDALDYLSKDAVKIEHEATLDCDDFKGFIDLVVQHKDGTVSLYDFKYSNNIEKYKESPQLSLYKYFYEKLYGKIVVSTTYVFIPKTMIRQKKTETLFQFRDRIKEVLEPMNITLLDVEYNVDHVIEFYSNIKKILEVEVYEKNETKLCDWCNFKNYCQQNIDYDIINKEEYMLPSSQRRELSAERKTKIWIYGPPMSGKTTMLDGAPVPLNLNTDGNTAYVTMPVLPIKDVVTVEGRITKRKLAWEVFKDAIAELEKKQNDFKTIILDLVEDTREMCRIYKYNELNIQHESDSGYGKGWDIIKTEYLSTMRRFFALPYDNIVIVSHEDLTKDLTIKSGDKITKIAPNIPEAIATKLGGMVDIIGRVVVEDNGDRTLNFKRTEVVFGGGRIPTLNVDSTKLTWDALMNVFGINDRGREDEAKAPNIKNDEVEEVEEVVADEFPVEGTTEDVPVEEKPVRKRRTRGGN